MDIITIDGMVENDFRQSIEDMLRLDQVDEAIERLRHLLGSSEAVGKILPDRFLEVTSADLEIGGWQRLDDRLLDHDRPNFPITAIGVTLADATKLGGPGPSGGRLAPFIKTFYFSDEAYPFREASRDDLLDGYSRDGFELQGDYRATDATLSVKGIDDLYGAIVELEAQLFDTPEPADEEIRAGAIGACFVAALIHQALRDTIRLKGLPRPLCVFAACDGVYPFFDAPVTGADECTVAGSVSALPDAALQESGEIDWQADDELADEPRGEASLLTLTMRREGKTPVMVLDAQDAEDGARDTEMAAAQRMLVDDETLLEVARENFPVADPIDASLQGGGLAFDQPEARDWLAEAVSPVTEMAESCGIGIDEPSADALLEKVEPDPAQHGHEYSDGEMLPDIPYTPVSSETDELEVPMAAPSRHSLRATINLAQPDSRGGVRDWLGAVLLRIRWMIFKP